MSSMTSMAATLGRARHWPFLIDGAGKSSMPACTPRTDTRTSRIRQLLAERGPLGALQIAAALDLDSVGRVAALLKHDLAIGRVVLNRDSSPGRYRLSESFDRELRREITAATTLLRRHGFTVTKAKP